MNINGLTPMTVDEFFAIPTGSHIFNYGNDQCVALANLYTVGVLKYPLPSGIQSAFQWWTEFGSKPQLVQNFVQVTDTPKRGDIFVGRYGPYQAENGHIGVVERDWNGSTFGTMENGYWNGKSSMQRFNRNMANILGFLRPITNISPIGNDYDMPRSQYFNALSNSPSGIVSKGEWWVRATPGAPLVRITAGQAYDQFKMDGLDFTSPNVFTKEGSWFDLAFSEDNEVFKQSVKAHPWMASGGAVSVDPSLIAKAVNDDVAKRMSS